MERNPWREYDPVGPARAETTVVDAGELALPKLSQCHLFRIEREADPFGVADTDPAVTCRAAAATHHRLGRHA